MASHCLGRRSKGCARRWKRIEGKVEVHQAKLGQAVAQDLVGFVAAIKGGKKLDDFLINKSARNGRGKRRSKR
jgi:hypothetical protein